MQAAAQYDAFLDFCSRERLSLAIWPEGEERLGRFLSSRFFLALRVDENHLPGFPRKLNEWAARHLGYELLYGMAEQRDEKGNFMIVIGFDCSGHAAKLARTFGRPELRVFAGSKPAVEPQRLR